MRLECAFSGYLAYFFEISPRGDAQSLATRGAQSYLYWKWMLSIVSVVAKGSVLWRPIPSLHQLHVRRRGAGRHPCVDGQCVENRSLVRKSA